MAYSEILADRLRNILAPLGNVEEKPMMGGLTFMYHDKMCVGIIKDELMCRIDPLIQDELLEKKGCRMMDFTHRPMKGYILVEPSAIETEKELDYWVSLALDFNPKAKSSKKKKK